MGAGYSLRKQRREKLEKLLEDNKVQPQAVVRAPGLTRFLKKMRMRKRLRLRKDSFRASLRRMARQHLLSRLFL